MAISDTGPESRLPAPAVRELAIERLVELHFVDVDVDVDVDVVSVGADAPDVEAHALRRSPRFRLPTLVRIFMRDEASR